MSLHADGAWLRLSVSNPTRIGIGCTPVHSVDHRGGTIGSGDASWCLADDRGWIASRHAELFSRDGAFCLRDLAGMTWINGAEEPLGAGSVVELREGDQIRLGALIVSVGLASEPGESATGGLSEEISLDDLLAGDATPLRHLEDPPLDSLVGAPALHNVEVCGDPLYALDLILDRLCSSKGSPSACSFEAQPPVYLASERVRGCPDVR